MKSKYLGKKLLVLLLAVMLIIASMTACGGKDDDDDEDKESKSKKELSIDKDDDDEEDDEKDEDDEDDVEPTPEPTAEPTPEPTAEPTPEPTEEPTAEVDWETAYEDYFETWGPLVEENAVVIFSGYEGDLYTEMAYGYSGDYGAFSIEIDEAYLEIITDPESVYLYTEDGDDYQYAQAVREDDTDTDFLGMAESMEEMIAGIEYDCYLMESEEYGDIYDIVACYVDYSGEECEAFAYINRETQNMELLEIEDAEGNYIDIEVIFPGKDGFMEMIDDTIVEYEGSDEVTFDEMGNMAFDFLLTMMSKAEVDTGATGADEPDVSVGTEGDDWSTAYDNFFDNGITIPESFEITTQMDLGGIVLDYTVAQDKAISLVRYRIGDYGVDAYTDGSVIVMENIGLNGSEWVSAEIESGDDMADILGADFTELMGGVTDSVSSAVYVEAVEENGVVYDVMEIDGDGTLVYINRNTQTVSKLAIEAEGLAMECKFEGFTPFEVPAESANATAMTKDELATYYQDAIVESVYASMGMEY